MKDAARARREAGTRRFHALPNGHETMTALEIENWLKEQEGLRGRQGFPAEPADLQGGPRDGR